MSSRMLAEWEDPSIILMAYPNAETDWSYILEEAKAQFDALIRAIIDGGEQVWLITGRSDVTPGIAALIDENGGKILDIPYNDTWTRDYGPLTLLAEDGKRVMKDFGFNGWGLKFAADRDNLVTMKLSRLDILKDETFINERRHILEGGAVESDGRGIVLTTTRCLCEPNRNGGLTKPIAEEFIKESLEARKVLMLDYGFLEGDDTDSHIDTLARFAPDNTIVYVCPPEDREDPHFEELVKMEEQLRSLTNLDGRPFRLIALPFPDAIFDEDGCRLPATYANFLVTGRNVFMPTYGQAGNDRKAREAILRAFPGRNIFEVDCRTLIRQHGSLHCSTMQLYLNPNTNNLNNNNK